MVFDGILVAAIVWLAWRSVADRDPFRQVVQFIVLGLFLALAWVRLRAPDIALAEAAVGSGLTGALMVAALARARRAARPRPGGRVSGHEEKIPRVVVPVAATALFAIIAWALLGIESTRLDSAPAGLTERALAALPQSGVENPVTAAVLNYRAYDTLLELGVLLLAIAGIWTLRRAETPERAYTTRPILVSLLHVLVPSLCVAAGYLLWVGSFAPGGAFQGGALLGGAIVLAWASGRVRGAARWAPAARAGLGLGPAVFALAAVLTFGITGSILGYPEGSGGTWILAIESAALISIGLTLGALFVGGRIDADPAAAHPPDARPDARRCPREAGDAPHG